MAKKAAPKNQDIKPEANVENQDINPEANSAPAETENQVKQPEKVKILAKKEFKDVILGKRSETLNAEHFVKCVSCGKVLGTFDGTPTNLNFICGCGEVTKIKF